MNFHNNHPIVWNQEMGLFVYAPEGYNGPSTKQSGRVASEISIQHHIARQLEIIANALVSYDDDPTITTDSNTPISFVNYLNT